MSLELHRARKALELFCARRNSARPGGRGHLSCRRDGDELEIVETGAVQRQGEGPRALVRLSYVDALWWVFWSRHDGSWEPYPHLPRADSVDTVIDELEQAPLHVHWD